MNTNCSGHSELRDPDWYDADRSLARARNQIIEPDATSRMNNSITSLNVDSLTIAEMNDQSFNHYSIRSLPVFSSTTNAVTRIATAPDAPWNESTRSLRVSTTNNIVANSNVRTSRATKPPPGVSALDHLQNSLSSLVVSSNTGLPHDIVALEDESEYDSLAGDQEDSLNGSFASLRLADVMNTGNEHNEMDATAHAGNVHRTNSRNTNQYQTPVSPLRSPMRSSHSYRPTQADSSLNGSYASARSVSSPTRNGWHHNAGVSNEVPLFNTLDEHTEYYNDGCDLGDNEDDNNVEIIKVLRTQIDTLKYELLKQQEENQKLIHQYEYKNEMSQFMPMDSIAHSGKGSFFSYGNESFVSTRSSNNQSTHHKNVHCEKTSDFTQSETFLQYQKQLSDAELGIVSSIETLKASLLKRQSEKENRVKKTVSDEQQPVSPESDESNNNLNDGEDASMSLLDELAICELEMNIKSYQKISKMQFEALYHQNEQLQAEKVLEQTTRIMESAFEPSEK